jgi:hypothetical protein
MRDADSPALAFDPRARCPLSDSRFARPDGGGLLSRFARAAAGGVLSARFVSPLRDATACTYHFGGLEKRESPRHREV